MLKPTDVFRSFNSNARRHFCWLLGSAPALASLLQMGTLWKESQEHPESFPFFGMCSTSVKQLAINTDLKLASREVLSNTVQT